MKNCGVLLRHCWFLFFCLSFFPGLAVATEALQPVPVLRARVTDLTGTLSEGERAQLESKLQAFEARKGVQLAVLIVPTVRPENVEQYALRVVESWRLGRRGVDDGVLLLVAKTERRLRIEVGYGLEGVLSDVSSKRIIAEIISPHFKAGRFYAGIDAGLEAMMQQLSGEVLPLPQAGDSARKTASLPRGEDWEAWIVAGLVLVFFIGGRLRAWFGRVLGTSMVATLAGLVAWLFGFSLILVLIISGVAFVLSLTAGTRGIWRGIPLDSGWGGRWGGGGGGGFSGGGGSFGGGGASGGW